MTTSRRDRTSTSRSRLAGAISALVGVLLVASCAPPADALGDVVTLASGERWSSPEATVRGGVFLDYFSPRSPHLARLWIQAESDQGNLAFCFSESAFGAELPSVGFFGPEFLGGPIRQFSVGPTCASEFTNVIGWLNVTELETGERDPNCNGCEARPITRLRAAFGVSRPDGQWITGTAVIG